MIDFEEACALVARALDGPVRRELLADASKPADVRGALLRLRDRMRANTWTAGPQTINLSPIVNAYDERTRRDGFHVLHDWDGKADTVSPDTIPVDVLHYVAQLRGGDSTDEGVKSTVLAIMLDYYFLHLLALLSLRIWDGGDPDANLDRVNQLLVGLQGPDGSGQRFVDDAETLILIATSHFELVEVGYDTLLARVRRLNRAHQLRVALVHAASIGSHLRFGFEATYGRDTIVMRNDNVADYPWLCFALETSMEEYARLHAAGVDGAARDAVAEAILNGLSPDARAFIGEAPPALAACEAERARFRGLFERYKAELLPAFERHRPSDDTYSPLSFFFNFSHNILKGTVVDALLRGRPWDVTFNDLLCGPARGASAADSRQALATTLMGYARANPDRIRGRLMPVIVYDPQAGREFFTAAMRKLRE